MVAGTIHVAVQYRTAFKGVSTSSLQMNDSSLCLNKLGAFTSVGNQIFL